MVHKLQKTAVMLLVVVLVGAFIAPAALAWGPAGRDGWYQGPTGWYQGAAPWGGPQNPTYAGGYGYPYYPGYAGSGPSCAPGTCSGYNTPLPYQDYVYEGYYAPYCTVPQPYLYTQPSVAPLYQQPFNPQGCYNCAPLPSPADRCGGGSWGTFGTYDNWAREFSRMHGRNPNEQDIHDYWYSQRYASTHCGDSPW